MSPIDALITQGWGRIAYNVVRSLGRKGLRVAVGMDQFRGMAALSHYCSASFAHRNFISDPKGFIDDVQKAIGVWRPKVYLPTDQEILVVAKYRDALAHLGTQIPIADFDTLRRLHKKDDVHQLASSLEIPTPDTIVPKDAGDVTHFARTHGDPIVVKCLSSSGARGVYYVNGDAIPSFLERMLVSGTLRFGAFLVQRYVKGAGYGVSMLFNEGRPRALFTHKRLREKFHTGGVSTLRVSTENRVLEEYAERILGHVKYHGVAMVEFKYDEERQQGWLLEVNPRFWGSLALAIQAGVDFPYLLYRMATEGDIRPVTGYLKDIRVRWLLGDVWGSLKQLQYMSPFRSRQSRKATAAGFDDLYWDDPVAFLGEIAFTAWKQLKTRKWRHEETDLSIDQL